jgi:hypothetical protein
LSTSTQSPPSPSAITQTRSSAASASSATALTHHVSLDGTICTYLLFKCRIIQHQLALVIFILSTKAKTNLPNRTITHFIIYQ